MTASSPNAVLTAARAYVAAGLSIIPVGLDGRKQPAFDALPRVPDPDRPDRMQSTWKPFEERRPTDDELQRWFDRRLPYGIAVACGAASGGAECIDLDDKATAREFCQALRADAPDLYERLSLETTPRGLHLWYRADAGEGNRVLASRPEGFDAQGRPKSKKTIETRGQGGYAIVAGSPTAVHESGLPYEYFAGPALTALERVSAEERDYLFRLAMSLHCEDPRPQRDKERVYAPDELSPGDDYDLRGPPLSELLTEAVFTNPGEDLGHVRRPGKERGNSASVGRCKGRRGEPLLKVFTSNWPPFEAGKCYGRFQVLRLTRFDGDGAAATRALRAEGYGSQQQSAGNPEWNGKHTSTKQAAAPHGQGEAEKEEARAFDLEDAAPFLAADYPVSWLADWFLVRGQPGVIAAPSKSMKTSFATDLVVSLATATPVLGHWPVRQRVRTALVSAESGKATIKETVLRVLAARGLDAAAVAGWLKFGFDLPTLSEPGSVAAFGDALARVEADVIIADPTYLTLGDVEEKSMFRMGPALNEVVNTLRARRPGLTVLFVHHANRTLMTGEVMQLKHIAYSGFDQFARQWFLLNRREEYRGDGRHELWLSYGGSAGASGLNVVGIEEGVLGRDQPPRTWDVTVTGAAEARDAESVEKKRVRVKQEVARDQDDERAVLDVIRGEVGAKLPGASKSWIGDHAKDKDGKKIGDRRAKAACERLFAQGVIVAAKEFRKPSAHGAGKLVRDGYALAEE